MVNQRTDLSGVCGKIRGMRSLRVVYVAAVLMVSCSAPAVGVDMGVDGDRPSLDGPQGACFTGVPTTELELLNRCTDADRIDRATRVPTALWDGAGPLPPLP